MLPSSLVTMKNARITSCMREFGPQAARAIKSTRSAKNRRRAAKMTSFEGSVEEEINPAIKREAGAREWQGACVVHGACRRAVTRPQHALFGRAEAEYRHLLDAEDGSVVGGTPARRRGWFSRRGPRPA